MKLVSFTATMVASLLICSNSAFGDNVFFDDFDGGQMFGSGVSGGFTGVTGTVSVEGYGQYYLNSTDSESAP